ncbi:hypothetical protein ACWEQN_32060 [Streptomyces sp. NPDC004129]
MPERVIPGGSGGLISLGAADVLWVGLTTESAVPAASAAFTCSPADARVGYVLLGGRVVATVKASGGQWSVLESEVRRAAAELNAVEMDCQDLVRIGPFGGAPKKECNETTLMRWRQRITGELQELGEAEPAARRNGGRLSHLAGIDWRRMLVERTRDRSARTRWLPRAVVRPLDAAEHTETQWLQAAVGGGVCCGQTVGRDVFVGDTGYGACVCRTHPDSLLGGFGGAVCAVLPHQDCYLVEPAVLRLSAGVQPSADFLGVGEYDEDRSPLG